MKFEEAQKKFFEYKLCLNCKLKNKLNLIRCRSCFKTKFKKRKSEIKKK